MGDTREVRIAVSILTRPGGRVLHVQYFVSPPKPPKGFNPHPARGPGAAATARRAPACGASCFNPHPARGPGAAGVPPPRCRTCPRFNPHPARGPGAACPWPGRARPGSACFNPHPARGPGAAGRWRGSSRGSSRFNPHPARGPGAAVDARSALRAWAVSILTRPGGRVLRLGVEVGVGGDSEVSILTRPGGRVLHASTRSKPRRSTPGFNPHPARGPGAALPGR